MIFGDLEPKDYFVVFHDKDLNNLEDKLPVYTKVKYYDGINAVRLDDHTTVHVAYDSVVKKLLF